MGKSYKYNEDEYGRDYNSYRRLQDRKKKARRDDQWLEEEHRERKHED